MKIRTKAPDEDGLLVFADGYLVAMMVRLSALHGDLEGCWHLEFAGGLIKSPPFGIFEGVEVATEWISNNVAAA